MAVRIVRSVLASLLFCLSPLGAYALPTVVDFETLSDSDALTSQLTDPTFANATVLAAGLSLNEFDFPPQSGTNVVTDDGGPITIDFASPLASVGGYLTYITQLTLEAYAGVNLIGSVTSAFSNNSGTGGDLGSIPNEFLSLAGAGITRLIISGDPGGSSFVLDDLTYTPASPTSVPEPGSLALIVIGAAFFGTGRRRRGLTSLLDGGK